MFRTNSTTTETNGDGRYS